MDPPRTVEVSGQNFLSWRDEAVTFEELAARAEGTLALTGVDEARRAQGGLVSSGHFSVFGVSGEVRRRLQRDHVEGKFRRATASPAASQDERMA